jgi:hypothetical protein
MHEFKYLINILLERNILEGKFVMRGFLKHPVLNMMVIVM